MVYESDAVQTSFGIDTVNRLYIRLFQLSGVDTNWKVRCILIEKSSIHNLLQNYYKFKIFIYLVSFFVFP